MTIQEFVTELNSVGYPVAYSHFNTDGGIPVPQLPYITYLIPSTDNIFADNKTYKKINNIRVELYTINKDLITESLIEEMLDRNEIPYDSTEVWIESEKVFQQIYEMRMI